jgi:hypothetical protein
MAVSPAGRSATEITLGVAPVLIPLLARRDLLRGRSIVDGFGETQQYLDLLSEFQLELAVASIRTCTPTMSQRWAALFAKPRTVLR